MKMEKEFEEWWAASRSTRFPTGYDLAKAAWNEGAFAEREAEREACAKVCEEAICECCWEDSAIPVAEHIAEKIRNRGA